MRELSIHEIQAIEISGGEPTTIILLGVLAFCYYERNEIYDFAQGVFEGIDQTLSEH